MAKPNPPRSAAARFWLWFSLLILLACFFRFYDISGPSLWMDEIWSIELSTGRGSAHDLLPTGSIQTTQFDLTSLTGAPAWWKIWTTMGRVIHPPLYHIALRWWMDGFGNSPTAARTLSAVVSLAAILVFFDVCRLLHGPSTALWAVALMALSVAQLEFGQEARSYPMLIFLGLGACDALVRIEIRGADFTRLFALGILLAAAQLTHYFAAPGIAALAVYAIFRLEGRDRIKTLATFAIAGAFVAIVWGPRLIDQLHAMPSLSPEFLQNKSASPVNQTLGRLLSLPGKFFCGDIFFILHPRLALLAAVIAAAIVVPLPIVYILARRKEMFLWILWLTGIVGFLAVMDLFRQASYLQYLRYSILASPAVYAMLAGSRKELSIVVLAACAVLAIDRAVVGVPAKGDWRQLADAVETYVPSDHVLAIYYHDPFVSPGMWYMAMRYYQPDSNRPWLLLRDPADDRLQTDLHARGTLWLATADPGSVIQQILPGWRPLEALATPISTVYHLVPETPPASRP